jgi:2-amino-4-hydroxy-6-hydroxymethyldihydropteridine diphosphokinase
VRQIQRALTALRALTVAPGLRASSLYQNAALAPPQPDYINAVAELNTTLPVLELLAALQAIEQQQGRARTAERWASRVLDLDLLLYGELCLTLPSLQLPHPGLATRTFVLVPLMELNPQLQVPGLGSLSELLIHCPPHPLECLPA